MIQVLERRSGALTLCIALLIVSLAIVPAYAQPTYHLKASVNDWAIYEVKKLQGDVMFYGEKVNVGDRIKLVMVDTTIKDAKNFSSPTQVLFKYECGLYDVYINDNKVRSKADPESETEPGFSAFVPTGDDYWQDLEKQLSTMEALFESLYGLLGNVTYNYDLSVDDIVEYYYEATASMTNPLTGETTVVSTVNYKVRIEKSTGVVKYIYSKIESGAPLTAITEYELELVDTSVKAAPIPLPIPLTWLIAIIVVIIVIVVIAVIIVVRKKKAVPEALPAEAAPPSPETAPSSAPETPPAATE